MRAQYLRQQAIDDLHVNLGLAKPHYISADKDWFLERFARNGSLRESSFEFDGVTLSTGAGAATDEEYHQTDAENVRRLYGAMRRLPSSIASDERFWTGMAHTYFWDYVMYRRRSELASGTDQAINTSFFFMHGARRSSYVHCLSRLWWAGKLTYDESNRSDPFHLTDVFTDGAIAGKLLLFSSRNFTANKNVTLGILEAVRDQRDAGVEVGRKHFSGAALMLNRISGITLLDCLSRAEVRAMVNSYLIASGMLV